MLVKQLGNYRVCGRACQLVEMWPDWGQGSQLYKQIILHQVLDIKQTRAKPGAALETASWLIDSFINSVSESAFSSHSFTAPPRPNS